MERKVGEIFEYNGEWYQCLKSENCDECAFLNNNCTDNPILKCGVADRTDNCCVIFKKLEKVGEPFTGKVHIQLQRYKIYTEPKINSTENVGYIDEGNTIAIEIKNKENMEENKLNLKPFDLEAAKAGKPVCTRDGRKARIICFDRKDVRPIIALIESHNDDEGVYYYYADGLNLDNYPSVFDLMMPTEKKEGWINIYNADTTFYFVEGMVYDTKEEAIKHINPDNEIYITTVKIQWEE